MRVRAFASCYLGGVLETDELLDIYVFSGPEIESMRFQWSFATDTHGKRRM